MTDEEMDLVLDVCGISLCLHEDELTNETVKIRRKNRESDEFFSVHSGQCPLCLELVVLWEPMDG